MLLPKKISPNPLVISTVELRYSSTLDESSLLSKILPCFLEDFPKFTPNPIDKQIRKANEQFKFSPDYTLQNNDYSLSIGSNVITFENVGEYQLWSNYFQVIKKQLSKFFSLNIIQDISRIGVRYASILEDKTNIENCLKYSPSFSIDGFTDNYLQYRSEFKKGEISLHLNIVKNAKVERNTTSRIGTLIDIDASYFGSLKSDTKTFDVIDKLHTEEKHFFFNLLTVEYMNQLNPEF